MNDQQSPPTEPPVSTKVVTWVATRRGEQPSDLRPLGEVIDPDALDSLAQSNADGDLRVTFRYAELVVSVSGRRVITVERPAEERSEDDGDRD